MKKLVGAHNCIFGSRFLGVYAGSLREWSGLQEKYECYFVLDDLVGYYTQPTDSATYADKAMYASSQFLAAGASPKKSSIALASEIPELYEMAFLLGHVVDLELVGRRFQNTLLAHTPPAQRDALGLRLQPSFTEASYCYLGISSYVLGVGADYWHGGNEIRSNHAYMCEIADSFNAAVKRKVIKSPALKLSQFPQFSAIDGSPMTYTNRLAIDASEEEIQEAIEGIRDHEVLAQWLEVAGLSKIAKGVRRAKGFDAAEREALTENLVELLAPFRSPRFTNRQVLSALSAGTRRTRVLMQETLRGVRGALGMSSYLRRYKR
jgi:tRNA synthetases class I (W and Y)